MGTWRARPRRRELEGGRQQVKHRRRRARCSGSFLYRCPPCGFDMHPTCRRLPQVVRSAQHTYPAHDLTLVVADGCCAACNKGVGRASYYRCTTCNIDLHVSCAAAASNNNSAHEAEIALQAEIVRTRIAAQGRRAALDLLISPAYTVRREYF
ncbi:uncharacterized protein LOC125519617 [Triticum urartu]|uniref:uncharacterized protein LOC125519617 n=1 Tax=Triticum urartu TaxID=4572 RepID=UPI002044A5B5|nr:uncharacterized protein LOC125519617 [Triticum urartu]